MEINNFLVDVSDIVYFFFSARGSGRGSPGRQGGGGGSVFLLKIPGEGGGLPGGGWGEGAGRVSAGNCGGGGAKYLFSGPNFPPR